MHDTIELILNPKTDYDVKIETIVSLLRMEDNDFENEIVSLAREITLREFGNTVFVCGLLAFNNNCYKDCTYCGLRKSNSTVPRFSLTAEEIKKVIDGFSESGIDRVFLVSGEDKTYPVADILQSVAHAKKKGLHVTLGLGEYSAEKLKAFKDEGTDCYALKFETSNTEMFRAIKPTTTFESRMSCIRNVKPLGMELGSGNIVGLKGQTLEDIAADILLMYDLDIDWAPVVPYIPAPGTPMAEDTMMGNVALTLRVLSILRILIPHILITASQPSQGSELGFADPEGNKNALHIGANIFFVDVTPHAVRKDFEVIPRRIFPDLEQIKVFMK